MSNNVTQYLKYNQVRLRGGGGGWGVVSNNVTQYLKYNQVRLGVGVGVGGLCLTM